MLPMVFTMASKAFILPDSIKSTNSIKVRERYVMYSIFAESLMRTVTFSTTGPGVSAFAIKCPLIPRAGRIEMTNTSIPIPPSQWIRAFQSRRLSERTPFAAAEHPVVVNPDVDSKKASI